MRRTVSLSIVAACLMILASALHAYSTYAALLASESWDEDLFWLSWQGLLFPSALTAAFLVRGYILASGSNRPYRHIILSSLLVFLVAVGSHAIWIWANWPQTELAKNCIPMEGKTCFAIYSNQTWSWSEFSTVVYPILALMRSLITAAWAVLKYQYK